MIEHPKLSKRKGMAKGQVEKVLLVPCAHNPSSPSGAFGPMFVKVSDARLDLDNSSANLLYAALERE